MNERALPRLAILVSGNGTNLQAFIDACSSGALHAEIALVLSNNPDAGALQRASKAGIATQCIDHRTFANREAFDAALVAALQPLEPDLVVLAGFMRILTPVFIEAFTGRLFNIHPSLLPRYPGLNTHQRAIDAGDTEAGVTVHFVTLELDGGPPVLQARVPIDPDENAQSLAAKVRTLEHRIYPRAVEWFLDGRLRLAPKGALLDGEQLPPTGSAFSES